MLSQGVVIIRCDPKGFYKEFSSPDADKCYTSIPLSDSLLSIFYALLEYLFRKNVFLVL